MKPIIALVLAVGLSLIAAPAYGQNSVHQHPRVMRCHNIAWENGQGKVADLIRCAARVWDAPRTPDYAVCIARHESGLNPDSYNPNGHVGLFQHTESAWPGRVRKFIRPLGFNATSWHNGEINTIVAMRMAHADGDWGQWTTAGAC